MPTPSSDITREQAKTSPGTPLTAEARERARLLTIEDYGLAEPADDPMLARIVRLAKALLDVPIAAFSVVTADAQVFNTAIGLAVDHTPRSQSFCAHTLIDDTALVIPDATTDARFRNNPLVTGEPGIRAYAGMPVRAPNGVTVGALCVIDRQARTFEPDQLAALSDLRLLLEEALVLRSLSVTDPLTGLYNRRHLEQVMLREWRRAYRHLLPLSVLLIDLDHFKVYNDHYGHLAGDTCLRASAQLIAREARRAADLSARFGGEEFLLLLPETPLAGARAISEGILQAFRDAALPHAAAPCGFVTVSVGGAVAESTDDLQAGPHQLVTAADNALYRAKNGGRNSDCVLSLGALLGVPLPEGG